MTPLKLPYARVLVVDDVSINLDVVRDMMEPYGMRIDCVTSGRQAIDAIRNEEVKYNAVFMDQMMPGMDGIEATRIIREEIGSEYARTVPIIAFTADDNAENEKLFLDKGFQAFVPKPIKINRLDAVLREWVQDKTLEQTNMGGEMPPDIRTGSDRRNRVDRRTGIDRRMFSRNVPGINIDKGIETFSGNKNSYLQILASYAANMPPLLDSIKEANRDNLADYAIAVHGIKGSSRGICAEEVGDMAEALERAAKRGDIDFVMSNNAAFIQTAGKLAADIADILDKIAAENPKPKKDKPDPETLSKLLTACEAYNMDGVDEAMEEIEKYEYESGGELALWLRENVDVMNFAQIKEKLVV